MKLRVLNRDAIMALTDLDRVLSTVEGVYAAKARGGAVAWPTVFYDFKPGEQDMDIRSGYWKDAQLHGLKVINWTMANAQRGLPPLIGVILVFDTETGLPLGLLDGGFITGLRTGCAGAVGARHLARRDSRTLFVLGTGPQAFYQVGAFLRAFPGLRRVYAASPRDPRHSRQFVSQLPQRLKQELHVDAAGVEFVPVGGEEKMAAAVWDSDMVVTITPARTPVIRKEWVKPGTHFSCVGADMSGKEEIDEELFRGAKIYCDDLHHCAEAGEMEIPLLHGVITPQNIQGEIGQVITGAISGRTSDEEITIYDACGMALLDIATAKTALTLAEEQGLGQVVDL